MKKIANILLIFAALAAGVLVQVMGALTVMIPAVVILKTPEVPMGLTVFITHVFLMLCFGAWYCFACCQESNALCTLKYTLRGKNILIILLLAIGGCFLTNFLMPIASMVIPESIIQDYMELMEAAGFGESIFPTIAAVAIAPFGEELLFRGVVYHYATNMVRDLSNKRRAFYISNVIQALAFGIFHGNLIQGVYAFALGLLLGYLRERFGSIWASIMGHILINACSAFIWEPLALRMPESLMVYAVASVACFGVMWLGFQLGGPAQKE